MALVLTDAMESIPLCTGHWDTAILAQLCPVPVLGGIPTHVPPLCFHLNDTPGMPGTGAFTPAGIPVLWHCLCQGQLDQRSCSRWI